MRRLHWMGAAFAALAAGAPAVAGDVPLYQPAPAWVVPAPLPAGAPAAGAPSTVIFDVQQRIEGGRLWSYVDTATRMASPEMLAQFATLAAPWAPDKGDLIVHELAILRGDERIDLLAQGQKFTVLRREEALEQRELTGILTATLPLEGLRAGDVLRMRVSTTSTDDALGGNVQSLAALPAEPARAGMARMQFSWPTDAAPRWKVMADGLSPKTERKGGYTQLTLALPAPKQPEMPGDAPKRFQRPPLVALSTFDSWADVSKVFAPLYETKGAIAPGGPLAAEVAAIMAEEADPLARTQRALQTVQDKVRYLALGMDGGNYVPQKPEQTWTLRYGDCKAKTLLLLAMLHDMGIEAEPVLAHGQFGDLVPEHLPAAQAFDHVLVRATVNGETLWLDGTASGTRLPDIGDTPPFHHVLPVRAAGAELVEIAMRPNARPSLEIAVEADESASIDLPSVFDATAVVRGPMAAMLTLASDELGEEEKKDAAGDFFQEFLGQAQFASATMSPDPAAGTVTLKARGVTTTPWEQHERTRRRGLTRALGTLDFTPDRARPAWQAIPVATPDPLGMRFSLRLRLPEGGRGYVLEGEPELSERIAGFALHRTFRRDGDIVTVEERTDSFGAEIPAARVPAERDRLTTAQNRAPRLIAPEDARRRWDLAGAEPAGATQLKAIAEVFAAAIAAAGPEDATAYISRAAFRRGVGDPRGAREDLTKALTIAPSVDLYLQRAYVADLLGDLKGAAADAEAARALDPSSAFATGRAAWLTAEQGDLPAALALLDERIALGGDTSAALRETKAKIIGNFGEASESLALFDTLIAEKPGSPSLLNGRCWVKGTRDTMLDTALKDCTGAIELSTDSSEALDSRALIWYRMGRDEDALRDLDAALAAVPDRSGSRFLRALVLSRLGRGDEAKRELAVARRLKPTVDKYYKRFGLTP